MEQNANGTVNQPTISTPPPITNSEIKPKKSKSLFYVIVGVVFILLISGIAGGYFLGKSNSGNGIAELPESTISPVITSVSRDALPQENVLYFDNYEGVDGLFYTNKQEQKYSIEGVENTDPYLGILQNIAPKITPSFDFKKLSNPRQITIENKNPIHSINNIIENDSKTKLYLSINLESKNTSIYTRPTNNIYQINLDELSTKEIWSNVIGSEKYKGKGAVYLDQIIEDKFIVAKLFECFGCGGHIPTKTIIINVDSKGEKYLEEVGDIKLDITNNSFSYRKLAEFKEACEPNPICDENGQMTVMKPDGQTYTDKLP